MFVCLVLVVMLFFSNEVSTDSNYVKAQVQMDEYLRKEVIQNLILIEDVEPQEDLTTQAQNLVRFTSQMVSEKFPKDAQNADTFIQTMTDILSTAFQWASDDVLNVISWDDVELDSIQDALNKMNFKIDDLTNAIVQQPSFFTQVIKALELCVLEVNYNSQYEAYQEDFLYQ
eukprot:TRINITY_DN1375_c1_g1_i3.p2 TRINITY_DN1375_c1_g1~~TRINITY_DN1375_c1_g1_i3.p2  ORF type:complete len:172 (-),score=8.81 TRINITY_DN1375_c1_g1_i3:880-1395(-)